MNDGCLASDHSSSSHSSSEYSIPSARYFCTHCQRAFSSLHLSETAECPRCSSRSDIESATSINNTHQDADGAQTQSHSDADPESHQRTGHAQLFYYQRSIVTDPIGSVFLVETTIPFGPGFVGEPHTHVTLIRSPLHIILARTRIPAHESTQEGDNQQQAEAEGGETEIIEIPLVDLIQLNPELYTRLIDAFLASDPNRNGPPPAPQEVIDRLPEIIFGKGHEKSSCSICQDDYNEGDRILHLPCKHTFHKNCVTKWLTMHNSCPMCRLSVHEPTQNNESSLNKSC